MKNAYEVQGAITVIFLQTKDGPITTTIDTVDLERVRNIEGYWYAMRHKSGHMLVRAHKQPDGSQPFLHRLIAGAKASESTAHADGNTFNNRRSNLRNLTRKQTLADVLAEEAEQAAKAAAEQAAAAQQEKVNPDKLPRGVRWHKVKRRWEVAAFWEGKRHYIGRWKEHELDKAIAALNEFRKYGPQPKGDK